MCSELDWMEDLSRDRYTTQMLTQGLYIGNIKGKQYNGFGFVDKAKRMLSTSSWVFFPTHDILYSILGSAFDSYYSSNIPIEKENNKYPVRPHIEYANQVWSPYLTKLIPGYKPIL